MLSRDERWWREHRLADPESWRRGASRKFYAAVEVDGEVDGYALLPRQGRVGGRLPEGRGARDRGSGGVGRRRAGALGFLHGIDLITRVVASEFDPGSPLPLLVRDPRALGLRLGDGLWLRLVDVDAALQARSYKTGAVGRARGDATTSAPGTPAATESASGAGRTDDTADLALDVADLASAYLGAYDFHRLARRRSRRRARRRRRRGRLAPVPHRPAPFCPEVF